MNTRCRFRDEGEVASVPLEADRAFRAAAQGRYGGADTGSARRLTRPADTTTTPARPDSTRPEAGTDAAPVTTDARRRSAP